MNSDGGRKSEDEDEGFNIAKFLPAAQALIYERYMEEREAIRLEKSHQAYQEQINIALGNDTSAIKAEQERIKDESRNIFGRTYSAMARIAKIITNNTLFQNLVTLVIILAGITIGAQTDPR